MHDDKTRNWYELLEDVYVPGAWALRSPVDDKGERLNPWQFHKGRRAELTIRPRLPLARPGHPVDFSQTGLGITVVHARVVAIFERLGVRDVQFIPASVESQTETYFILNINRVIKCIDDRACEEVVYWTPEDEQPAKVGEYRLVRGLRIDRSKVGDAHIFLPWGWYVAIIISEELKQALERERITGVKFTEV
jgi:hypothetical protein